MNNSKGPFIIYRKRGAGMGEKMGELEILVTVKTGVLESGGLET